MKHVTLNAPPLEPKGPVDQGAGLVPDVRMFAAEDRLKVRPRRVDERSVELVFKLLKGMRTIAVSASEGAGGVVGSLRNFRLTDDELRADLELLVEHPSSKPVMEAALRMPNSIGISLVVRDDDRARPPFLRPVEILGARLAPVRSNTHNIYPRNMNTKFFDARLEPAGTIDDENAVIRGVSVVTKGAARGHDLEVDDITLEEVVALGESKGQVPVKVDHKSGSAALCGFLADFRLENDRVRADWHLLESHPLCNQILETARRMPGGAGLSLAFIQREGYTQQARPAEILSVDYVSNPAANPSGLFSRRDSVSDRIVDSAEQGARVGAAVAPSLAYIRESARRKRFPSMTPRVQGKLAKAALGGAAVGVVGGGALGTIREALRARQAREQRQFEQPTVLRKVERVARREIAEGVREGIADSPAGQAVESIRERPKIARAVAGRAVKIAAGAGLGMLVDKKLKNRTGMVAGAIGGALFSDSNMNEDNCPLREAEIIRLADTASPPIRAGRAESHDIASLARRLGTDEDDVLALLASGALKGEPLYRDRDDGPQSYRSDDLNDAKRLLLVGIAREAIAAAPGGTSPENLRMLAADAVRKHLKEVEQAAPEQTPEQTNFSRRPVGSAPVVMLADDREERPGLLRRVGGIAAAGLVGVGAAYGIKKAGSALAPKVAPFVRTGRLKLADLLLKSGQRVAPSPLRRPPGSGPFNGPGAAGATARRAPVGPRPMNGSVRQIVP